MALDFTYTNLPCGILATTSNSMNLMKFDKRWCKCRDVTWWDTETTWKLDQKGWDANIAFIGQVMRPPPQDQDIVNLNLRTSYCMPPCLPFGREG